MTVFDILVNYREGILNGLLVTLQLCLVIWTAGLVLGSTLGIAGAKWFHSIGIPSRVLSFILSGVPVLALLFWLHYPLQDVLRVVINPFYTAVAALSVINILAVADTVRGVLRDFPVQYIVAAQVSGLSPVQTLLHIQFPIVLRQVIPSLLQIQVNMLQATLFASLISVDEIFRVAQRINAVVYRPVEIYTALALLFLSICLPLNGLALWLRNRFTRDLSER
jgi:His/Glu/Gln/Arg/opine family amino acid ABC transporter permease subunit